MKNTLINWDETLALCNNNKALACDLIKMLRADLPRQKQILLDAYDAHDTQMMRDIVHQILGSCSYVSLPNIKKSAEIMHLAIHQNTTPLPHAKENLITAMNAVIMTPTLDNPYESL